MLAAVNKYPSDTEMSLDGAHLPPSFAEDMRAAPTDTSRRVSGDTTAERRAVRAATERAMQQAWGRYAAAARQHEKDVDAALARGRVEGAAQQRATNRFAGFFWFALGAVVMWLICGAPTGLEPTSLEGPARLVPQSLERDAHGNDQPARGRVNYL